MLNQIFVICASGLFALVAFEFISGFDDDYDFQRIEA
tara:strand:- start:158 stop:268 length:111 start_codon:yes stop_codon:yes gene_type:complete